MPEAGMAETDAANSLDRPLVLMLVVIALGGAVDLILDAPAKWRSAHVVYELSLLSER